MKKRDKIKRSNAILKKLYGVPEKLSVKAPLDVLIAVILSQNTSDKNSVPAFENLKKTFSTWERVMNASEAKIAKAIKRCGLANVKAKRIKEVLIAIRQRIGKLDISFLGNLPTVQASEFLLSLKGVGPKSAAVVLNFAFGMPTFPVDTHVYRVSRRLGLIGEISREKAHVILEELVPDKEKTSFHLNLIKLGREICTARKPRCLQCPLKKHCVYFKKVFSKR